MSTLNDIRIRRKSQFISIGSVGSMSSIPNMNLEKSRSNPAKQSTSVPRGSVVTKEPFSPIETQVKEPHIPRLSTIRDDNESVSSHSDSSKKQKQKMSKSAFSKTIDNREDEKFKLPDLSKLELDENAKESVSFS